MPTAKRKPYFASNFYPIMSHFIESYWRKHKSLWDDRLITRFPPEPNGYSHLGHAKSMFINHSMATLFGGSMHLRMDDTNPEKESDVFADSIREMATWLGYGWSGEVKHTSDYFDRIHTLAFRMIDLDFAYMDFSERETFRTNKGTLTSVGVRSMDANQPKSWHADMFSRMTNGEFEEGRCVLRAKIDMNHPNMNLRDPVLYRIKKIAHNRTGENWCVYPSYAFAHPASDYFERISLSLCTLEFEELRPLYDWVIAKCLEIMPDPSMLHPPVELEFARLELDRGLTSKRKINALVESGQVDGWDDPRLVTLSALRRRGFTPRSIRMFCEDSGVSKANSTIPFSRLEDFLRFDLDADAPRRVVVARPVSLHIESGAIPLSMMISNHPKKADMGTRPFDLSQDLWIGADDVRALGSAEAGFKRVEPGAIFRVMPGLVLECLRVDTDSSGAPSLVTCRVSELKPRATIHGLSKHVARAVDIWEPSLIHADEEVESCLVIRHGYAEPLAFETLAHGMPFDTAIALKTETSQDVSF
jgi:glutaminyl-tRNA synthetase